MCPQKKRMVYLIILWFFKRPQMAIMIFFSSWTKTNFAYTGTIIYLFIYLHMILSHYWAKIWTMMKRLRTIYHWNAMKTSQPGRRPNLGILQSKSWKKKKIQTAVGTVAVNKDFNPGWTNYTNDLLVMKPVVSLWPPHHGSNSKFKVSLLLKK